MRRPRSPTPPTPARRCPPPVRQKEREPMTASDTEQPRDDYRARIAISWTVVVIPLAYGLFHAVKAALQLFGG
ncbi:hypothetical protein GCM10027589_54070 [Actinocorallia lasiicapitis]